jgi:hypothetical protein
MAAQTPPPQWGPPVRQAPPPKARKPVWRRWWFWLLVLLGLLILGGLLGGDPAPTPDADAPAATRAAAKAPGIGDPARDGLFEFVVASFRCEGERCQALLTVKNIGQEPGDLFAGNQYLLDRQDRKYEADPELTSALFYEALNPGRSVRGRVGWAVPEGFRADRLELHDSAFSGGVEVSVR